MPTFNGADGTRLYYKDWGAGRPIVFSHGWPLSSDAWDEQMFALASNGYRCIAHDRRGHGRSDQPWNGNDMDAYADDLAALVQSLDLQDAVHVGHSTGGGEVARYVARHGTTRVAGVVLIGAVTPIMLKCDANPIGLPMKAFDDIRAAVQADRSEFFMNLPTSFYNADQTGASISSGLRQQFWRQGMQGGLKNLYDCVAAFSETNQTEDLKRIDVPTLILHGDADKIVPIDSSARLTVKLVPNAELKIYEGASHGLTATHTDRVNQDLLSFIKSLKR